MKTQKKLELLFLTVVFAVFNLLFFLLDGVNSSASVWIAYGVMCFSFIVSLISNISSARSERNFAVVYIYFLFNVILTTVISIIQPNNNTAVIITEIIAGAIWLFLIAIFVSADKHADVSSNSQAFAVDGIRRQANRVKSLIGKYMNGKLDAKLENVYDDLRLLPAASIEKSPEMISKLDFAVTELENVVKNEYEAMIPEAFEKLNDIIDKIKTL